MTAETQDEYLAEIMAAGALVGCLSMVGERCVAESVFTDDGVATATVLLRFPNLLKSQYEVTLKQVPMTGEE